MTIASEAMCFGMKKIIQTVSKPYQKTVFLVGEPSFEARAKRGKNSKVMARYSA